MATAIAAAAVAVGTRRTPWPALRSVSWSVLVLVGALFILVEGLVGTGVVGMLGDALRDAAAASITGAAWTAGAVVAVLCNLVNNLPAGLVAGSVVRIADVALPIRSAVLLGIDLGPNLSVTGSLATLLWLIAIRREGVQVSAGQFFRAGVVTMPISFLFALTALLIGAPA
ncbi:MAG: ArsB/NhaD family transporter [Rhizobacter sp.]